MKYTTKPGRSDACLALGILTAINFLNYIDRYVVASVVEPVKRELHFSDLQLGWIGSAFMISYAVTSPVFGRLGDLFTRKYLVAIGVFDLELRHGRRWARPNVLADVPSPLFRRNRRGKLRHDRPCNHHRLLRQRAQRTGAGRVLCRHTRRQCARIHPRGETVRVVRLARRFLCRRTSGAAVCLAGSGDSRTPARRSRHEHACRRDTLDPCRHLQDARPQQDIRDGNLRVRRLHICSGRTRVLDARVPRTVRPRNHGPGKPDLRLH